MIGKILGKYQIESKLGEGGMGAVYKGYDRVLDRYVAIKILPDGAVQNEQLVRRFEIEARSAAKLQHPNIVQVIDYGKHKGQTYLVLQFIQGKSLSQIIQQKGPLSVGEAIAIISESLKALKKAHSNEIVHRDIKPDNIMVSQDGEVKVTDFGIAKIKSESQKLTVTGQIMGTPYYMSPEQCQGHPVDGRSDLYALGATFYYILAGSPPFNADSALVVLNMHIEKPLPNLQDARPDVPDYLVEIIEKMMAKNPEDRFQTAEEILTCLQNPQSIEFARDSSLYQASTLHQVATLAGMTHDSLAEEEEPAQRTVPLRWVALGGVVLLIFLVLLLILFKNRHHPKTPKPTNTTTRGEGSPQTLPHQTSSQKKQIPAPLDSLSLLPSGTEAVIHLSLNSENSGLLTKSLRKLIFRFFRNTSATPRGIKIFSRKISRIEFALVKPKEIALFITTSNKSSKQFFADLARGKPLTISQKKVVEFSYKKKAYFAFFLGENLVCTNSKNLCGTVIKRGFESKLNSSFRQDISNLKNWKTSPFWAVYSEKLFRENSNSPITGSLKPREKGLKNFFSLVNKVPLKFLEIFGNGVDLCTFSLNLKEKNPRYRKDSFSARALFATIPPKAVLGTVIQTDGRRPLLRDPWTKKLFKGGKGFPFWRQILRARVRGLASYICLEKARGKFGKKSFPLSWYCILPTPGDTESLFLAICQAGRATKLPSTSSFSGKIYVASPYLLFQYNDRIYIGKYPHRLLQKLQKLLQVMGWVRKPRIQGRIRKQIERFCRALRGTFPSQNNQKNWPRWLKREENFYQIYFSQKGKTIFYVKVEHGQKSIYLKANVAYFPKLIQSFF